MGEQCSNLLGHLVRQLAAKVLSQELDIQDIAFLGALGLLDRKEENADAPDEVCFAFLGSG